MAEKYDPKTKGIPTSWRTIHRKLPRSLSTFQIVIMAGFLSLLIMRSTVGIASVSLAGQYRTAADDEYGKEEQSRVKDSTDVEPKRNLVQTGEFDIIEKLKDTGVVHPGVDIEKVMDRQIAGHKLNDVKATRGEDVKNVKEEKADEVAEKKTGEDVKNDKVEESRKAIEKTKRVISKRKEEIVEDFEQVEAELGEEETAEDLAGFEKFEKSRKGEIVSSTEQPTNVVDSEDKKNIKLLTTDPEPEPEIGNSVEEKRTKREPSAEQTADPEPEIGNSVEEKKTKREPSAEQTAEKVSSEQEKFAEEKGFDNHESVDATELEAKKVSSEQEKFAEEKKSDGHDSIDAKEAGNGDGAAQEKVEEAKTEEAEVQHSEPEQPVELTPEELAAFTKEAIANMSRATRRNDPNAFTLGPKISNWDEQRAAWLEKNPDKKSTDPHKPKVLLVTGSQPLPCRSPVGDHYLLKMMKNKMDYARIHKMETFYNFAYLDKPMSHYWAKLPLIRKMMLMRPEVEWIFWMDSDALFTDMVFEIPFERYQDQNLVMWGYPEGVYDQRSWVACNTGVMFLRNNQWTLDLLDIWSHMGPEGEIRDETGKILSSYLQHRPQMMADDQSALVFLMLTMPELRPKIALEAQYSLSGYWVGIVDRFEEFSSKSRPGAGGLNWPFTTHFTGCQPCTGYRNEHYEQSACLDGMERAFNFADNQVLRPFGFEHENLHVSKVLRIRNETTKPIYSVPVDNPWAVEAFYS